MKIARITLLALLAGSAPALAQMQPQQSQGQGLGPGHVRGMGNMSGNSPRAQYDQAKRAREVEKEYNATIKHIPTQKPADPWGKMR